MPLRQTRRRNHARHRGPARETAQRRSETPDPIESQSDLGLDEPTPEPTNTPRQTVHEKAAALSAAAAGATGGAAAAAGSRRELLPDIEEINSNLDQDETKQTTETSNSEATSVWSTACASRSIISCMVVEMTPASAPRHPD